MGEFEGSSELKEATPVVQERKTSNTGLKIAVVALCAVVVGLGAFIVMDKNTPGGLIANKEANTEKDKCVSETKSSETEQNKEVKDLRLGFVYDTNFGDFYVTKKGDVYLKPNTDKFEIAAIKNLNANFDAGALPGVAGEYTIEEGDIDPESYAPFEIEDAFPYKFDGYKLDLTNISYMGEIGEGQSYTGSYYALIDGDGNLNVLRMVPGGLTSTNSKATAKLFKKFADVSDAVATEMIEVGDGVQTMVFTKDGGQRIISLEGTRK